MSTYPSGDVIVAAIRPTPATRRVPRRERTESERHALRADGATFANMLLREIKDAAEACTTLPGGDLMTDLCRGRAASIVQYGAALAALARDPSLPAWRLERLFLLLLAWAESLRPAPLLSFAEAMRAENREQFEADDAMSALALAWERKDPVAMRRAMDELADHIGSLRCLKAVVARELHAIEGQRPPQTMMVRRTMRPAGVLA